MNNAAADCPFCRIWNKDLREGDGEILLRLDHAMILVPLHPVVSGHVMAIPSQHVPSIRDGHRAAKHALNAARYWTATGANPDPDAEPDAKNDFNLILNDGPSATQSVYHLHFHIVPRKHGDGLPLPWSKFNRTDIRRAAQGLRNEQPALDMQTAMRLATAALKEVSDA